MTYPANAVALAMEGSICPPCAIPRVPAVDLETLDPATGMPRIPDQLIDCVVFLYRSVDDAKNRRKLGGTGFIVGRPMEGVNWHVPYLVSNWHVALGGGASVASVNRKDGYPPAIFDLEPADWIAHPDGDDLAAICIADYLEYGIHEIGAVREDQFVNQARLQEWGIGVGDEVVMLGRFVNHQGRETNKPAARFGSISIMLDKFWSKSMGKLQEGFAVEMRSRTGFSGSPVLVYRTSSTVLTKVDVKKFSGFLGVNFGYVLDEDGENTWLNGVIPAWKVTEILDTPTMKAKQKEIESRDEEEPGFQLASGEEIIEDVEAKRDKMLETMLNTPPDPKTKKKGK